MHFPRKRLHTLLSIITIIPAVLLAAFFLFLWVVEFDPDFTQRGWDEGNQFLAVMILTVGVLIYTLFRPYSGGFFLCICAVPFGIIVNAVHLSEVLFPSREVGYHHFWSAITGLILLLGVLSVIRGHLSRLIASEAFPQAS